MWGFDLSPKSGFEDAEEGGVKWEIAKKHYSEHQIIPAVVGFVISCKKILLILFLIVRYLGQHPNKKYYNIMIIKVR